MTPLSDVLIQILYRLRVQLEQHERREPSRREFVCDECGGEGHDGQGRDLVTGQYCACPICGGECNDEAAYQDACKRWQSTWEDLRHQIEDEQAWSAAT